MPSCNGNHCQHSDTCKPVCQDPYVAWKNPYFAFILKKVHRKNMRKKLTLLLLIKFGLIGLVSPLDGPQECQNRFNRLKSKPLKIEKKRRQIPKPFEILVDMPRVGWEMISIFLKNILIFPSTYH